MDLKILAEIFSVLGAAALVAWRFSAVATELRGLTKQVETLVTDFKSERTLREAQAQKLAQHDVLLTSHGDRIGALERKVDQ